MHDEVEGAYIYSWCEKITDTITLSAMKVAGKKTHTKAEKLSEETLKLLKKRRELKQEKGNQRTEYAETCKTIRKQMKDEIRQYNMKKIEQTIQQHRSPK